MDSDAKQMGCPAFTLVELLVVIAIIGILVSFVVPGVWRARELSDRTGCAANLRAIGVAIMEYAGDNKGAYPGPVWAGVPSVTENWQDETDQHRPLTWRLRDYLEHQIREDGQLLFPSAICPLAARKSHPDSHYRIPPPQDSPFGRKVASSPKITYSDTVSIFRAENTFNKSLPDIIAVYDFDASNLKAIHAGGRNYLFLDGHVEWIKGTELLPKRGEP